MLIKRTKTHEPRPSEITPESIYRQRRNIMGAAALAGLGAVGGLPWRPALARVAFDSGKLGKSALSTDEAPTDLDDITHYNNFYELGTRKSDPARHADELITDPWSISVSGHCEKPGKLTLEDFLKGQDFEERIYRLRCVEGWSMVIPWVGFPLSKALARFQPTSRAKYVAFESLLDPEHLHGQRRKILDWPYREGLRMDEAMHPLTILAVGLYGKVLPNQNGAPIRLVVPWKYGFKSIKSIVAIRFIEQQPPTTWNQQAPDEYGFYSNVNPEVPHPRWSQRRERRIGEFRKRKTLKFNGYAEEVASLYRGMDLKKYF
ncbi:MAG TPA: protein-methionine-sulfoxide reductase catalytic subunit MsrP [Gammaproteobacteria bacterium]|nr:protein-methionine-sulfoxide reductase catalytic subunit MsrP [Gammaproteobacteria bacterium]